MQYIYQLFTGHYTSAAMELFAHLTQGRLMGVRFLAVNPSRRLARRDPFPPYDLRKQIDRFVLAAVDSTF